MFHGIKTERSIASWLGSLVASMLAHGGLGFVVLAGDVDRAQLTKISPAVDVTLRLPPLPAPPPPAVHPARVQRTVRPTTLKIPAKVPLQPAPSRVPDKLPEFTATRDADDYEEGAVEGGVIGGVIGGVVGGQLGGEIGGSEGPPVLLGAGMTHPMPSGECSPAGTRPRPITPEQARRMSVTGTVLVEYTVHSDGRAGEISMRNNGPPILFDAVKRWLEECSFSPSLSGATPIGVKVIQPFVFQTSG